MEGKRKSILHCFSCMYYNAALSKCENENGLPHPQADDYCPYAKRGEKPATNLYLKCGSCIYAEQIPNFCGSTMYVKCTNPDKYFRREYIAIRQRTTPCYKKYVRKENDK